ncbi:MULTISPECIES: hypothetical protein [unclassified Bradyrhizobium]|uniref:hypothetical protein n=1 Tax=unclassified Bradyrhizobium TaxID=2631580 RepID=UPI001BA997D7|nr:MULTISPECIES: hypothetical protein [unclassified Bradyrhizobium]MBR1223723.1 hypothetical protein [Bradyrhizobium sp. AUGA SZCCT0176]MBR1296328.1 hypothetical protein [Bradyrhizobium sp. AUGA SZCCT0042]
MFGTTRGMLVPARKHLFAVTLAVIACAPVAASANSDMVDVSTLPRLEGAVEQTALAKTHQSKTYQVTYDVPTGFAATTAAVRQLLAADGWVRYAGPLENDKFSSKFKKGRQGLFVSVPPGKPNQSSVIYSANAAHVNVPFPPDAADIVFEEWRPYLGCIAPTALDATLDFFRKEMAASGWKPLKAAEAAARWPNVQLSETIENGVRAYYTHDFDNGFHRQQPVMLTLQRRDDGRTDVEIRVAPFAMPETLEAGDDTADLPTPKLTWTTRSSGDSDSARRQLDVAVLAEIPATLAFYRRELAARNWTEETSGAVVTADNVTANFSSAEQTATLELSRRYDMTMVNIVTQMKETVLAERAQAKKEADAAQAAKVAQAAKLLDAPPSDAPLRALADNSKPVPLPENAEEVEFEGADGRLSFDSPSSVRAVATFYRDALQAQGWKEQPSVINDARMVVMQFSKGGKAVRFNIMKMGRRASISANGSGLVTADAKMAAKPGATAPAQAAAGAGAKAAAAVQVLEADADPDAPFPVPKQHSAMSTSASGKLPGSNAVYRRQLDASIPAELNAVLAFYRRELGKRGWTESTERAVVQADRAQLAFTSPDGPAMLKLGRSDDETSVILAQKYPAVAAKADFVPKPGHAKLMLGNVGESEAAVTINKQTIKLAAGAGGLQSPRPPILELPPGKYRYSMKVAGRPARNDTIEVTADDGWGLIILPSGEALSMQMY